MFSNKRVAVNLYYTLNKDNINDKKEHAINSKIFTKIKITFTWLSVLRF